MNDIATKQIRKKQDRPKLNKHNLKTKMKYEGLSKSS